jgi:hypothetical protein
MTNWLMLHPWTAFWLFVIAVFLGDELYVWFVHRRGK